MTTIMWHMCGTHRDVLHDAHAPPETAPRAGPGNVPPFFVVDNQLKLKGASANVTAALREKVLESIEPFRDGTPPLRINLGNTFHLRIYPLADGWTNGAVIFLYDGDTHARGERLAARYRLTAREVQVLDLAAIGLTNAEIAAKLCIAASTAAEHVASLCRKMDCARRWQLLSKYFEEAG